MCLSAHQCKNSNLKVSFPSLGMILSIPPLPPNLTNYVTIGNITRNMHQEVLNMKSYRAMLIRVLDFCSAELHKLHTSDNITPDKITPDSIIQMNHRRPLSPICIYYHLKLKKSIFKEKDLLKKLFADYYSDTQETVKFVDYLISNKITFSFNGSKYRTDLDEKAKKIRQRYSYKIAILKFKITYPNYQWYKNPYVTLNELLTEFENYFQKFQPEINYCSEDKFDILLEQYLACFQIDIKDIFGRNIKDPVFTRFAAILNDISIRMEITNEKYQKYISLRSSLFRIAFHHDNYFMSILDQSSEVVDINCVKIQNTSLVDLDMPNGFYNCEINHEILLKDALENDIELKKASDLIKEVQFITNPLEIINNLYKISQLIDKRIKERNLAIAFDDYFILFVVVVTMSPPSNSIGIAQYLDKFATIDLSPQFQHAATSFSAAIDFIQSYLPLKK